LPFSLGTISSWILTLELGIIRNLFYHCATASDPKTDENEKKYVCFPNFRITIADFGSAGFGNASKPEVSAVVDDQVEISQNFLQP
jgi:hypothetical protein